MRIRVFHTDTKELATYDVLHVEIYEPEGDLAGGLRLTIVDNALIVEPLAINFNSGELYVPNAEETTALDDKHWNVPREGRKV